MRLNPNEGDCQVSYSFSIKANTGGEATQAVSREFAKVVESQPTHAADRAAVLNATSAFVGILAKPAEGECICVSVYGSLSWREENVFTNASVNITAYLTPK
jgi:hypothetical protein